MSGAARIGLGAFRRRQGEAAPKEPAPAGPVVRTWRNLSQGPLMMALSDLGSAHEAHGPLQAVHRSAAEWTERVKAQPACAKGPPRRQSLLERRMADQTRFALNTALNTHLVPKQVAPRLSQSQTFAEEGAFAGAVGLRFRGDVSELTAALRALPDDPTLPAELRHAHRLHLASALAITCASNVGLAVAVLAELQGRAGPVAHPVEVAQLEQTLAATPTGMAALCHVCGEPDMAAERQEAWRQALLMCKWLSQQPGGIPEGSAGTLQDHVAHAERQAHVAREIGTPQDAPLQLAHKALLYAHAKSQGLALPPAHQPAYVAWCNGFETSGKGSRFDLMLERLGKLWDYYQRAVRHGPRTAWNMIRDLLRSTLTLFGKDKPLMEGLVGLGTLGADQGVNQAEIARFRQQLRESIALIRAPLAQRAQALMGRARSPDDTRELIQLTIRLGVLDLWAEKGVRRWRPDIGELMPYIQRLAPHVPIPQAEVSHQLRAGLLPGGLQLLRLKHLEDWAHDAFQPTTSLRGQSALRLQALQDSLEAVAADARTPAQQADLDGVRAMLAIHQARHTARGRALAASDQTHLFQAQDLWNLMRRRPPRDTATPDHIAQTLYGLAEGDNLKNSRFVNQWGLNNDMAVWAPAISAIAPAYFGPDLGARIMQTSIMDMGTAKVGFVFKFGQQANAFNANAGVFGGARYTVGPASLGGSASVNGVIQRTIPSLRKRKPPRPVLNIMAPRERAGANYLDDARSITAQLLKLCQQAHKPAPGAMWRDLVEALGDNDRWSIGLSLEEQNHWGVRSKLNVGANFGPTSRKVGPAAIAQVDKQASRQAMKPERGRYQVTQSTWTDSITLQMGAGLATQLPFNIQTQDGVIPAKPLPLASLTKGTTLRHDSVSVHLTHHLGALCPELCYQDRWFGTATELARHVDEHRAEWVAAAQFTSHDGQRLQGAAALAQFFQEAQQLQGEYVFYERIKLRPAAAQRLNRLDSEFKALQTLCETQPDLKASLLPALQGIAQDMKLIQDERQSWACRNLYVAENKAHQSAAGIPVGLEIMATQRETTTAKVLKLTAV